MLKDWLLSNENNHLVYFVYDERKFNKSNWDAIMDEEEDRIASLLGRIFDSEDDMSRIFNQVHVPVGYDIFGIDDILTSEKRKMDALNEKKEILRKRLENRMQEIGV